MLFFFGARTSHRCFHFVDCIIFALNFVLAARTLRSLHLKYEIFPQIERCRLFQHVGLVAHYLVVEECRYDIPFDFHIDEGCQTHHESDHHNHELSPRQPLESRRLDFDGSEVFLFELPTVQQIAVIK